MALNTPLFERTQVGKREDLADYIALVDARDCPLVSQIPKGSKPGNTLMQWQADNMPAPQATGAVDGVDVTGYQNLNDGRALINNYIQVFQRAIRVSPLAVDVSVVAGLRNELSGMIAKGIRLMKRDMELTIGSDNEMQADNGTVPYLTRGLGKWIQNGAQTLNPVPAAYRTPTGSIDSTVTASFSETVVQNVLTSIYNQTGQLKSYDTVVGTSMKRAFSNLLYTTTASGTNQYQSIRTFTRSADSDTYSASVDVFNGDFGSLRLHASTFLPDAFRGYILDMDLLELRFTQMPAVTELPDAGGGPARLIKAVGGLVCKSPLGLGKFNPAS